MYKKLKVPCPNCAAYKLSSWSPAGLALTLFIGAILVACIPVIGWLLAIPLLLAAAVLLPVVVILYSVPKMRVVTARCKQCEWRGLSASLARA